MNIISWNLNGLRSCLRDKAFAPLEELLPDFICCQETKTKDILTVIDGYEHYFFSAQREKYSGVLLMAMDAPISIKNGMDIPQFDEEGRIITADVGDFYLVNVYVPNSQKDLRRHYYRLEWDEAFREYMISLNRDKPVIACGDFNVTMLPIDVFPENERQKAVEIEFASDERSNMNTLLESGFIDAFRYLYPKIENKYTWWSNRLNKRKENRGWRLDYFIVSEDIIDRVEDVIILDEIMGSDHCPIELILR